MKLRQLATPAIRNPRGSGVRIEIYKKLSDKKDEALKAAIAAAALEKFKQPAKPLQIQAVFNLARGKNTFLLAGTGFGKSRIPEIYYQLLRGTGGVVLVLNPLDALGNNQVLEKEDAGFTAINLTKLSFNEAEANKIANGEYNFVYLSPEIYLNSPLWEQVYFCPNFQDRLALVVVDEAHIIHQWGLMESHGSKNRATLIGMLEDLGIFRPSYGKLGGRLLTRNNKPILLMSATCRPIAIQAIKNSLKLEDHNLELVKGELTQPELRIIRVYMNNSMNSCTDLADLFPLESEVPNSSVVPSLIYCGTRHRTIQVMKILDKARRSGGRSLRPRSTFIRRFHAMTGDKDKVKVVEDYAKGVFPIISCTMALGMGQNWSRVRSVIQMGRADPSSICQMIGRCGRDGRPGLAIMLVEKTRKGGKNSVEEFNTNAEQGHDDRMDALAITPVCLRIAFAIDNELGYIPLSVTDPSYIKEQAREKEQKFATCHCSNCDPQGTEGLMRHIKSMTVKNMDEYLMKDWPPENLEPVGHSKKRKRGGDTNSFGKKIKLSVPLQKILSDQLASEFNILFKKTYRKKQLFNASNLFGQTHIDKIIHSFGKINGIAGLRKVIGGRLIPGQLELLNSAIEDFTEGPLADEFKALKEQENQDKQLAAAVKTQAAEARAHKQAAVKEAARVAKDLKDRLSRIEAERKQERERIEDKLKKEYETQLAELIRLAGEDAERRGVASIHRGRYK
ncbi:hypothetical protein Pst134EA_028094 [Puccinia striiformis f. sp. tritici]|uniref:hypothetical protein n=1 Tax=Puccinia striiformis f. sp. tritici TaxID=168172 RepID=UPI00200832CC|nr:hypothetical protein Pst134EA_028094 [Puccinia striiformis f. sp. tritici]KAH9448797.1 hypothetical protein Pst134EA_028094 [Puccinia striiformis f. sp. tritici]